MKKILILLCLASTMLYSQETMVPTWVNNKIYIDPNFSGTEKGTQSEPYKSVFSTGFSWNKKNAYLFKRGTSQKISEQIKFAQDSIVIGAYGTGSLPFLEFNVLNTSLEVSGTGTIINDISVRAKMDLKAHGIGLSGDYVIINNCKIRGGHKGLIGGNSLHLKIQNCDIGGNIYDGIYVDGTDTVTIYNTYVHDQVLLDDLSNQGSIDNIQIENAKMVYIDKVKSDHSNFPGKYCLIINKSDSVSINNSIFVGHDGNGAIYPGTSSKGWSITNCWFEKGYYGIQNNTKLRIYGCVFRGQLENAIYEGGDKWIYNCTFIDQNNAIRNWSGKVKEMQNCIFYNFNSTIAGLSETVTNNCFFDPSATKYTKGTNYITSDPQFADFANHNFTLKSSSPCINQGVDNPKILKDILGNTRPNGTKLDYGAYEYSSASLPSIFKLESNVTGCEDDTAIINLSGSQTDVIYKLRRNHIDIDSIYGNGNEISFVPQSRKGYYSVIAINKTTNNTNTMDGIYGVMTNPLPSKQFLIGGGYISSKYGGPQINLYSSEPGIKYQLYLNNVLFGSPIFGDGDSISFGKTKSVGSYTMEATNPSTNCSIKALNNVLVMDYNTRTASEVFLPCGDKILINNQDIRTPGVYVDTLISIAGFDSIVTKIIKIQPSITFQNISISANASYTSPKGRIYTKTGIYYDTIQILNSCDSVIITNLLVGNATNIDQSSKTSTLKISPNPSKGLLNISSSDTEAIDHIHIYNTSGILVYKKVQIKNKALSIDVDIPNGLYTIIALTTQGKTIVDRLLIMK